MAFALYIFPIVPSPFGPYPHVLGGRGGRVFYDPCLGMDLYIMVLGISLQASE
jgi:hypothetical protein